MPYVLSLATFLTILQLLDFLRPVYLIQIHRFWESTEFSLNISLTAPLVILSLIIVLDIVAIRSEFALIPVMGLLLLFLNPTVSIILVSSLCIITALFLSRRATEYFLGLMGLVCILEAGALLQWLIFTPLGFVNPLIGVADLESNLYYLVAQLSQYSCSRFLSWGS